MSATGVCFELSAEQLELRELARSFARDEVRPLARQLDRLPDPGDAYPFALVRRAHELGLRTLSLPRELGGREADTLTQAIVLEELCVGDAGFGMALLHGWREGLALVTEATPEQRERFLPAFLSDGAAVTSLALSEEHAGSDHVLPYLASLEAGPRTSAVLDGDEWVINGRKRWISNAVVSCFVIVMARTDPTVAWNEGVSLILVPRDAPGLSVGRIEDKLGLRVNQNAELVFDNCRVPRENLLGGLNEGSAVLQRLAKGSLAKEGVKSLGIARAAYEEALSWTRRRVQGGARIADHQAVQGTLARMATLVEASRAIAWRACWLADHSPDEAAELEPLVKVFCGESAVEVALAALELHGAYGVIRENYVEKLVRDATSMLHAFGGNHAVRSRAAAAILRREDAAHPVAP